MTGTRSKMMTALGAMLLLLSGISSEGMVDYFTDNGFGNPVAVMQHLFFFSSSPSVPSSAIFLDTNRFVSRT
jgi:hypothetical protein